jgi:hypothetical protein
LCVFRAPLNLKGKYMVGLLAGAWRVKEALCQSLAGPDTWLNGFNDFVFFLVTLAGLQEVRWSSGQP